MTNIEDVRRRHVIAFRDHMSDKGEYEVPTINKKISYLSVLISLAQSKGYIEQGIGGGLHIPVPEGESERTAFDPSQLQTIFGHSIYTAGILSKTPKAGGELQFWLPLISLVQGMSSSEIMQLGPDTITPHPDDPEVTCFVVTNSNDRRIKTRARQRYAPIRKELLGLGLASIIERARMAGWRSLWPFVNEKNFDVTLASGMFSS